ncbi:hypothetical protein [Yinghuangia soli]|uniref:Uncharacterized protein n=1 Tax=Yinghuangia soli TaxID=2908204 RepID=A0AA41Q6P6_9ACTN|nr:hypothetical protein [Yinghuangia soli]MCF2532256.1 hypothetical protein [Yinghuangia soli]
MLSLLNQFGSHPTTIAVLMGTALCIRPAALLIGMLAALRTTIGRGRERLFTAFANALSTRPPKNRRFPGPPNRP